MVRSKSIILVGNTISNKDLYLLFNQKENNILNKQIIENQYNRRVYFSFSFLCYLHKLFKNVIYIFIIIIL